MCMSLSFSFNVALQIENVEMQNNAKQNLSKVHLSSECSNKTTENPVRVLNTVVFWGKIHPSLG